MASPRQPPGHDDSAARPDGPWREEEKHQGAGTPAEDAGPAGEASTKARPNDDRARTEGAAAGIARATQDDMPPDRPAPDPDTVVVGGMGRESVGGAADPDDPDAPRNPL